MKAMSTLTTAKSDLRPSANIIPIGKQKIKEKNETINVKDKTTPCASFNPFQVQIHLLKLNNKLKETI